jgi:hypothetical protein
MFQSFLDEMNKDKIFLNPVGNIGAYKKNNLIYLTFKNKELPFKSFFFETSLIKTNGNEIDEENIKNIQIFINENLEHLILTEIERRISNLTIYLEKSLTEKAKEFKSLTIKYLDEQYDKENLINILKLISDIDQYQENFYEFFNIIAKDSSTPIADFLDPLYIILKLKLEKNGIDLSNFFDLFWEFNSAIKDNDKIYKLDFSFEEKEYNFNISTIEELVDISLKYFI